MRAWGKHFVVEGWYFARLATDYTHVSESYILFNYLKFSRYFYRRLVMMLVIVL